MPMRHGSGLSRSATHMFCPLTPCFCVKVYVFWESPSTNGQYADALSKGRQVWVLVAEVTGALDATVAALLRLLGSRCVAHGDAGLRNAPHAGALACHRVLRRRVHRPAQHTRAVKSDLAATPPPATFGDCMLSPAHAPPAGA